MSASESPWYVRNRGKVMGPFGWNELEAMRDRGQLARFHELSQDRRTWITAANLADLFPVRGDARPVRDAGGAAPRAEAEPGLYEIQEDSPPAGGSAELAWFFARGGGQEGPVGFQDLKGMASRGEITPETLIWKSGMPGWVPCRHYPDLAVSGRWAPDRTAPPPAQPVPLPAYGATGFPGVPARTSGLAVASLVLGILYLCGIGSLLATIFGAVSLNQIAHSNGTLTGKGMAIAGLVLGIIGLGLFALLFYAGMLGNIAENLQHRRF